MESHIDDERYPAGEVVGSTGKIGSYILHRLNEQVACDDTNDDIEYPQSLNVAAVPRGGSWVSQPQWHTNICSSTFFIDTKCMEGNIAT